jgi:hypothetical protein
MRSFLLLIAATVGGLPGLAAAQRGAPLPRVAPPLPATTGRLPRLLPAPQRPYGRDAWGYGPRGWSRPALPIGRPAYGVRHVRPLVVLVSPYGSVYTTSSYAASCSTYSGGRVIGDPALAPCADAGGDELGDALSPAIRPRVIDGVPPNESAAAPVAVEWLRDGLLRLRWTGAEPAPSAVTLVVADAERQVVATQRVQRAPFTAVFEWRTGLTFVGASVVRADGSSTLTLVPLGDPPATAR